MVNETRRLARASGALDASNFFLADVRDALGPYLAVYLLTERQWDAASIGLVMSIATVAGILAQTPAGALVDVTKAKRAVMAAAAVLVTVASLLLPWLSSFWPVAVSQATAHAAGVVFGPALAAVTLGIVGHRAFTKRIGRNESFNHAGNACAAAAAGAGLSSLHPLFMRPRGRQAQHRCRICLSAPSLPTRRASCSPCQTQSTW